MAGFDRERPAVSESYGISRQSVRSCWCSTDNTVPSLVVIEQLSLLTKNRLEACTEPTSDCEIGVTVSDHGM